MGRIYSGDSMNKKGMIQLWIFVVLILVVLIALAGNAGMLSIFYEDTGRRTVAMDASMAPDSSDLEIEYSLNAGRDSNDIAQTMIMFVKVNGEWLSADARYVSDRGNYRKNVVIPYAELNNGQNVVEFFFKADRSHPDDRGDVECWTRPDHMDPSVPDAPEIRVDDDIAQWMKELLGGDGTATINGVQYGIKCTDWYPAGSYIAGSDLDMIVYLEKQNTVGDPGVLSTTLKDLMDEKVNNETFRYVKEVVYLPGGEEEQPVEQEPPSLNWWQRFVEWLKNVRWV